MLSKEIRVLSRHYNWTVVKRWDPRFLTASDELSFTYFSVMRVRYVPSTSGVSLRMGS